MQGPDGSSNALSGDSMSRMMQQVLDTTIDMTQAELVSRFNKTLYQFVTRLIKSYKSIEGTGALRKQIEIQAAVIKAFKQRKDAFLIKNFYAMTHEYLSQDDMTRDTFVTEALPTIAFLRPLCIHEYWPLTPEETRESIWQYMQHLYTYSVDYHDSIHRKTDMGNYAMEFLQTDEFQTMMKALTEGSRETKGADNSPK